MMEAYCVKCKTKREMSAAEPTFTATGTPGTRGVCPVCETKMFRMGVTAAHEGLERPEPVAPKRKKRKKKRSAAPRRAGNLVIVESPAKARTIGKYLGRGYRVKASVGHVRDLLRSRLSVDVENDFEPTYRVPNDKRAIIKELKKDAASAKAVYLATDPDREGEAIAWHLIAAAEIPEDAVRRVVFNEVTPDAIREAFEHPRDIDIDRVNAQQARRILDRLVGYQISPLLWARVRGRLSAGRVQTVAVRLVVEREREIEEFDRVEYWTIEADLAPGNANGDAAPMALTGALHRIDGEKPELGSDTAAAAVVATLDGAEWHVADVRRRERKRNPPAPFTTSTLQQDASRALRFSARKTMQIAQQLYEGVEIGDGEATGLITYMRTDSVAVSASARAEAAAHIEEFYGAPYCPEQPTAHRSRARIAQEAHEAVRPTSIARQPQAVKAHLSRDQNRLYDLVWRRFVASQMTPAVFDTTSLDIGAGRPEVSPAQRSHVFRSTGSVVKFDGFTVVYGGVEEDRLLPALDANDPLVLRELLPSQHFTQPPPRFSEARLVRALEEHGIGRPSTYAPILSTIQQRGYVALEERRFYPTELGIIVNDRLLEFFSDVFSVGFTARMESELDEVARGEREWVPVLREFYDPFARDLERAEREMEKVEIADEEIGEPCPECEAPLLLRLGRYGKFVGCSRFPDCRYTRPFQEMISVNCPDCGGDLVVKRTRRGRTFYGCANYPECEYASWKRPLPQPCPLCNALLVQAGRERAQCTGCETRFELDEIAVAPEAEGEATDPSTTEPETATALAS